MFNLFEGIFNLLKLDFNKFLISFNSLPVELTWLFFLFFCFFSVLIFLKLFGEVGLYIYTVVAIIVANIQVLKLVKFSFFNDPVALGTILFASTFLCTDILSEHYGKKSARKNVIIGFTGFLLMTILILFTLGFKPLTEDIVGQNYIWALETHSNLIKIFLPFPVFFISSMIAYLISQFFDVWFFDFLSKFTNKGFLWLRNNISTFSSSLIDNSVFSLFAFIILASDPLNFKVVIMTYILGTYALRIFIAIIDTPFIYASKYLIKK